MIRAYALLPLHTLDLLRRYWAPLLSVYLAGALLHGVLMRASAWLGLRGAVAGMLGLSLALLVALGATLLMFFVLRPGLSQVGPAGAALPGGGAPGPRTRRAVDALSATIMPFLVFYSAWGLISEEFRTYAQQAAGSGGIEAYGLISDFDPLGLPLAVAVAAFAARTFAAWLYERRDTPVFGLATALSEAVWTFFAVVTVAQLLGRAENWLADRAVWVWTASAGRDLVGWLAGITSLPFDRLAAAVGETLPGIWVLLKDGLTEPLLWLAVAAIAFGTDVGRVDPLLADRRTRRIAESAAQRTPGAVARLGAIAGQGLRDKYVPLLNALRFLLSAGPVFFLVFCVCYASVEAGASLLHRGVFVLAGPADYFSVWGLWTPTVELVAQTVHEVLRVCLLAAAFNLVLGRMGAAGRRAPAQEPEAVESPERAGT